MRSLLFRPEEACPLLVSDMLSPLTTPFPPYTYLPLAKPQVLMPGFDAAYEAAMPFHPVLLSFLAPFNVVRFMDW